MRSFDAVTGNAPVVQSLKNAAARNKPAHAYIIEGAPGSGKTLLAETFAKALQCEAKRDGDACGSCVSCRTFDTQNHPDIIRVAPTTRKTVGVDDIREQVGERIKTRPYKYAYKIFIIKDADEMTPQAQNALLKALEEPAGYGVFHLRP